MDENQLREIARGNIERNLGCCIDDPENVNADTIYDEAYTLAFDALHDAGWPAEVASKIAREMAQMFAQP